MEKDPLLPRFDWQQSANSMISVGSLNQAQPTLAEAAEQPEQKKRVNVKERLVSLDAVRGYDGMILLLAHL